ncbi:hypothetical protein [Engelhardtia mirabilis]|uniref:Uncharacterized protein n=1 Tax=Engelhardtia mirabilis TaxID=2528011 RepID=A0A518BL23_9BACT|nr:hypothetical protein Pla133_27600 [Planctomycetes bacterium Pla133]QDV01998.1 hypothetical protein Pla86_27590 [Planctomycetes bacterium Pla86]
MKAETRLELLGLLAIAVFLIALWVGKSSLEARAFNRATGKSVTALDAMFTTLRVEGAAR